MCARERTETGIVGTARQRRRTGEDDLPVRLRLEEAEDRLRDRALAGGQLDHDQAPLLGGCERGRVDAERDALVVARETLESRARPPLPRFRAGRRRARGTSLAGSCGAGPRCARSRGTSPPVVVSASSSAVEERLGSPGSKPWTMSKRPSASVAARFARTPTGSATRSLSDCRHSRADRDDVADDAFLQRSPAVEQVLRPRGRERRP